MTLPQIELAVESIELTRVKHLDMLLSPILEGVGGSKYRSGSVKRAGRTVNSRLRQPMAKNRSGGVDYRPYDGADGENRLRGGLALMGLRVEKR